MAAENPHRNYYFIFTIVAVILLACSAAWHFMQSGEIRQRDNLVKNLTQSNDRLRGQLIHAIQSGKHLGQELEELQIRLEMTGESLRKLREMAWQEKFEKLHNDYANYREVMQQARAAAGAEEARLQRALAFHRIRNRELNLALSEANVQYQASRLTIDKLAGEKDQMVILVAELEKQLQTLMQVAEQQQVAASGKVDTASKNSQYRRTRLQSLQQALAPRDSVTRKSILLDVIPTIPSGVSAKELLPLVRDMNSGDILDVIRSLNGHIMRPIDNTSISLLAATMNERDAMTASLILSGSKDGAP